MSEMRDTMASQPGELRRILVDRRGVEEAAERLRGRRVLLVGTGTSWHAANIGAWFLRAAGVEAWAVQAADAALHGPRPEPGDGLLLLSHRGTKRYTSQVLERARSRDVAVVAIGAQTAPGVDIETVAPERSAAFTASHTAAMLRVAQIAQALGAEVGPLDVVPDTVAAVLEGGGPEVAPPSRLLELIGAGPNQWVAAEGALKVRETCYVATEGLSVEQYLHGPSVALGADDALVCLNGGGAGEERLLEVAAVAERCGVRLHTVSATYPNELLSVFPLTVAVQRIALELAERLGTNPDSFGRDLPSRAGAMDGVEL
jgi:glucosamine--fructose-6-phosphate aminotransferase (isomerizing)